MPSKRCPVCRAVIPASRFLVHKKAHDNATRSKARYTPAAERARQKAIRRDRRCVICGAVTHLEVDHIDGNPFNNEMSNLRVVCFDHNPRGQAQSGPRRTGFH